jgi:hypothetical protein
MAHGKRERDAAQSTDERLWRRWRRDIVLIEESVRDLVIDDHLFRSSMEILNKNDRMLVRGQTGHQWILRTYGRNVVVGIRRMLDSDRRSLSLVNLLRQVGAHNRVLCLQRFTRSYLRYRHDREGWRETAQHEFQDLVGDQEFITKRQVRADLAQLARHWRKLERVTHKRIAHYEPRRRIGKEPLWSDIHGAIEALERMVIRYLWLLRQVDMRRGLLPFEYRQGGRFFRELEAFWAS